MNLIIFLFIVVFSLILFFGIRMEFEASDIIAAEAACIAIFGYIYNYTFTQMAYKAANFPIPLIRPIPTQKRDFIDFLVVNPHKSILIKEAKLLVEMRYGRMKPNWLRFTRWKKICEGSTKVILPEKSSLAGRTANPAQKVEHHYPQVIQSYTLNNDEIIEVTGEYVFDLKCRIDYIPHIYGGKEQTITYQGTLTPETTSKKNLIRWTVDMVEYPPDPESTATRIG